MTKQISLVRLRDISRHRAIRKPLMAAKADTVENHVEHAAVEKVEWPISR